MKKRYLVLLSSVALVGLLRISGSPAPVVPEISDRARQLAVTSIIVDGHNDIPHWVHKYGFDLGSAIDNDRSIDAEWIWVYGERFTVPTSQTLRTHSDLDRMEQGALDAQFFSIFVQPIIGVSSEKLRDEAHLIIQKMNDQISRHEDRIILACTPEDVRWAFSNGLIAAMYGLEGGHAISDLKDVRDYREAGIRYVTIAWAVSNKWAGSSSDRGRSEGLSPNGRKLVNELNDLGVIIDVSHISDVAFWHVLDETRAPIIASHSSVRALVDSERNLSDKMLRAVSENGGVVMINFGGIAVDPRKNSNAALALDVTRHWGFSDPSIAQVADHIAHAVKIAGIDHVGLGSDFDGTLFLPAGLKDVSGYPRLVHSLIDRGFSERDIKKILGENSLRVMADVQSRSLQDMESCISY